MSMNIAFTGLSAATTDLTVISDNIANVNTTGFKASRAEFGDLVNTASEVNGMGVRLIRTSQSFSQGSIATTTNNFDLAIAGDGFFQVKMANGETAYTRAGAFTQSEAMGLNPFDWQDSGTGYSYLVNNKTEYLVGYGSVVSDPIATTQVKFDDLILNKNASQPTAPFDPSDRSSYNYATSLTVYDSEGVNHNLKTYFIRTANASEWHTYNLLDGKLSPTGQVLPQVDANGNLTNTPIPSGTLNFDLTGKLVQNTSYDPATGTMKIYTPGDENSGFISLAFDLGRNATLAPTLRVAATQEGDTFISGVGTVANGSDVTRSVAGSPDQLLRIELASMAPKKTDEVGINLNLASAQERTEASTLLKFDILMENKNGLAASPVEFSTSTLIYDGSGNAHTLKSVFTPTDAGGNLSAVDSNIWTVKHYLLGPSGEVRNNGQAYAGGTWQLSDVNEPKRLDAGALTDADPIQLSKDALGTGDPGFVIAVDFSDVKIISPPNSDTKSSIGRVLATSLTADPPPKDGLAPTLDPSIPSNYNYTTATTIYDSLGNPHTMNLFFRKIADNNWTVYAHLPDVSTLASKIGSLTFDTKGNLLAVRDTFGYVSPDTAQADIMNILDVRFPNGSTPQNVAVDFGGVTQFDSTSVTNTIIQNGYKDGTLTGVSVTAEGEIIAKYDNDQRQVMGQASLAKFTNPESLHRIGDNNWTATEKSGEPVFRKPGVGVGKLVSNALEGSNVDLTQQLVAMISAQRNFQANAQVITTNSTLYQAILSSSR